MNSFYTQKELESIGFRSLGTSVLISRNARFYGADRMNIGDNVRIDDFCILSGNITLGSFIHISAYCALYGSCGIEMEDFSGLSPRCTVLSATDDFSGEYFIGPMVDQHLTNVTGGKVLIKKYSQVGAGCVIFPNLTIEEGVAVGSMSLVNKSLYEWSICAGVPAKKIKDRSKGLLKLKKMSKQKPLVSVCMIAYNHANYISQAIEGVLMQQTTFPVELIIGEDCSTDNTRQICIEYKAQYPDIIRLRLPESNLGVSKNFIETMDAGEGKFIALCEGDDYWTDPYKLQKQVDFLEANPDYSLCCHRYKIYDDASNHWESDYGSSFFSDGLDGIDVDNKLNFQTWLTKSMTLVFRKCLLNVDTLNQYKMTRDAHLNYELLSKGKGYCFNFDGAVYRKHDGGVFSKTTEVSKKRNEYMIYSELFFFNRLDNDLTYFFETINTLYFDNLRIRVQQKDFSKQLLLDLFQYLKDESYRFGFKTCMFRFRKMLSSFFKCKATAGV